MAEFGVFDVKHLTVTECDEIALNNGGKASTTFGYGYELPRGGNINEEYSSVVVNTRGMGNHGFIVLVGRTPRARALLRQGKIALLMEQGIRRSVAAACVTERSGMEIEVARMADDLLEICMASEFRGHGHAQFQAWSGMTEYNLSYPRVAAAVTIAAKAAKAVKAAKR